jgi:intracellular septation protein A
MIETILPLIGGGIFGAIVKLISLSMQNKATEKKAMFDAFSAQQGSIREANVQAATNRAFSFTRRTIALSITAVIVVVAIYPITQPINVLQEIQMGSEYLFGLIDTRTTKQEWVQLQGSVILPVIMPSFQAIVGAYFGASIADHR